MADQTRDTERSFAYRLGYYSDEIGTALVGVAVLAFMLLGEYLAAAVLYGAERLRDPIRNRRGIEIAREGWQRFTRKYLAEKKENDRLRAELKRAQEDLKRVPVTESGGES